MEHAVIAEGQRVITHVAHIVGRQEKVPSRTFAHAHAITGADEEVSPLDLVKNADERFGSYRRLAASEQFRYVHPFEREKQQVTH